jgi:hypothetical protein
MATSNPANIGSQKGSTKDTIIAILSREWPLSAREIHNRLKRERAVEVTYQAAHKKLQEMLKEKALERDSGKYRLNSAWIGSIKKFADNIESAYENNNKINLEELMKKEVVSLNFSGILGLAKFLLGIWVDYPNPEKKPCICLWRNVYSIIGLRDGDYEKLKTAFKEQPYYIISQEDNLLDRMFADTLRKLGAKNFVFGVSCTTALSDFWVIGDYCMIISYPSELRKAWHKQNKIPKNVNDFDLHAHISVMRDERPKINVIISKNAGFADEIRKEYLPYFKGEKNPKTCAEN